MSIKKYLLPILLALSLLVGACQPASPTPAPPETREPVQAPTHTPGEKPIDTPSSPATENPPVEPVGEYTQPDELVFARFNEASVQGQASIQQPSIARDLSNVYNPFVLSNEQIARLGQDGFVVTPGNEKEFFTVYEKTRYSNLPVFITTDSLLHSYHLMFDKVLRTAERQYFIPLLKELNAALLQTVDAQYNELKGTAWEDAARRAVAFVAVASRLLDPSVAIPGYAQDLAETDLALVDAASGVEASAIFPFYDYGEDFTQYIPRGHYTLSEDLKAYFKSMMWYGRMTFRLTTQDPEAGRAETRSAILLVQALRNTKVGGRPALEAWADLYNPTVFFVGRSDDLTVLQYGDVIDQVYGPGASLQAVADDSKLDKFIDLANQLPPPRILGMVINVQDDEEATTKGLRFMGQRFVPDAYIFRQLIYRNVSTGDHRRGLPKGLDLLAAMGSERAYTILDEMGETSYLNYPEQMQKMRSWLSGLSVAEWTETLYNSWLYSFYPLLDVPEEGYPAFMRSEAWLDKQLNTVLGSWAELKHDTILYAKQAYAELGGGAPPPEPVPPKGYVEPVPAFYARLAALTAMTREGLQTRGLLSEQDMNNLQRLETLASSLKIMAEKELRGEALTEEEYTAIRFYGGELEFFVNAAADTESQDPFAQTYMDEEPQAAVIADVATDPDPDNDGMANPVVLEEAVGRINVIHAVVPVVQADGSLALQVARGGVFSYYEFQWPADDRLTDEKWRTMLDEGKAPDLPEWTASFVIPQGEYAGLQMGIDEFQGALVSNYWDVTSYVTADGQLNEWAVATDAHLAELKALVQNQQYVGRQLISSNILSFDLQSESKAVVTVRETWQDSLYAGVYPEYDAAPVSQRGPYTLDVTYTLQLQDQGYGTFWKVTQAAYASQPPEWSR